MNELTPPPRGRGRPPSRAQSSAASPPPEADPAPALPSPTQPDLPPEPASPYPALIRPPLTASDVNAAAMQENGATALATFCMAGFDALNSGIAQARSDAALAATRCVDLARQVQHLASQRDATNPVQHITTNEKETTTPRVRRIGAGLLILLSGGALLMSNLVGANYVVASGYDLYAANPKGAMLFMGIALLVAALLKAFHHLLPSDRQKSRYAALLFGLGIAAFLLWAWMMADTFAPASPNATGWLSGEGDEARHRHAMLLLFCHLLVDVTGGAVIFIAAEELLLAGHKRVARPNPLHQELTTHLAALEATLAEQTARRAAAEDYLHRVAAMRAEVGESAARACKHAALRLEHAHEAAAAQAKASFFTS